MSAGKPTRLLHFRVSHYNEKVRWALDFKGWPHVRQALVPGFHIPRVRLLTRQNRVPVIILDGKAMAGSSAILQELERRQPDPPLFPRDPEQRRRALALEAFFDDPVAPDLRRLFWATYLDRSADCARMSTEGFSARMRRFWRLCFPLMRPMFRRNIGTSPEQLRQARSSLAGYFDRLESEIGASGYLVGDGFGMADLAVASIMTALVRPPQFPYPLPEPWPPELVDLHGSLAERPAFRWVLDIYARHRGISSEILGR